MQGVIIQQIQMDLFSEDRPPSEALIYALVRERERSQANQQKMNNTNTTTSTDKTWFEKIQYIKRQIRASILPTPQTGKIQDYRTCGNKFLQGHLNICQAKNEVCRTCKKIEQIAEICKPEMPQRPPYNMDQRR